MQRGCSIRRTADLHGRWVRNHLWRQSPGAFPAGEPAAAPLGYGASKAAYRIGGGGEGVISIMRADRYDYTTGIRALLREQSYLNQLGAAGLNTTPLTVGTYFGQPASITPVELLHSRSDEFLYRLSQSDLLTPETLTSMQRARDLLQRERIVCLDYQGGIGMKGLLKSQWVINDPSLVKFLPPGKLPLLQLHDELQAHVENALCVKYGNGFNLRTGLPPVVNGLMIAHDLLQTQIAAERNPQLKNVSNPFERWWRQFEQDMNCAVFGACSRVVYET